MTGQYSFLHRHCTLTCHTLGLTGKDPAQGEYLSSLSSSTMLPPPVHMACPQYISSDNSHPHHPKYRETVHSYYCHTPTFQHTQHYSHNLPLPQYKGLMADNVCDSTYKTILTSKD